MKIYLSYEFSILVKGYILMSNNMVYLFIYP